MARTKTVPRRRVRNNFVFNVYEKLTTPKKFTIRGRTHYSWLKRVKTIRRSGKSSICV